MVPAAAGSGGSVRLVVEPHGHRHVRGALTRQQQPAGPVQPAAGEVTVRRDAELGPERAHQVGRGDAPSAPAAVGERDPSTTPASSRSRSRARHRGSRRRPSTGLGRAGQMPSRARRATRASRPSASNASPGCSSPRLVQPVDRPRSALSAQPGWSTAAPMRTGVEHVLVEVDHPLAEPGRLDRPAVVRHVRRQQRHPAAHGSVLVAGRGRSGPSRCRPRSSVQVSWVWVG